MIQPVMVENKMIVNYLWADLENSISEKFSEELNSLKGSGYREMWTGTFVPKEEAFEYALERCLYGTEEEQREFQEMLVEWFYSGNWIKED